MLVTLVFRGISLSPPSASKALHTLAADATTKATTINLIRILFFISVAV